MSERSGKQNQRAGVVICGAYGMSNAGDEAVLDALLGEMRSIDPEMPITVLSRTPAETQEKHGVPAIHMFHLPAFFRAMRRSRLYVNGGGSLIQDVTSSRSLWYYLFTLIAARCSGCRVMMYGCGVGPVRRGLNRRLTARVINRCVDAITLREGHSLGVLQELGVREVPVTVASDPALSLRGADDAAVDALYARFALDKGAEYFCICPRQWRGMEEKAEIFAAAADYARARYGLQPLLLSINARQDEAVGALLAEKSGAKSICIGDRLTTGEVIGLLARMRAVMAMRLHALIFSASQAVPLIGVSYDPKVAAFLDAIGQGNYLNYEDLSAPEQLYALIDAAMQTDRAALRAATERIMERERANTDAARSLLEQR